MTDNLEAMTPEVLLAQIVPWGMSSLEGKEALRRLNDYAALQAHYNALREAAEKMADVLEIEKEDMEINDQTYYVTNGVRHDNEFYSIIRAALFAYRALVEGEEEK